MEKGTEYYSTQVAKLVTSGKNGTTILSAEHTFSRFYDSSFFEKSRSLEPTGLERFVFLITQKK